MTDIIKTKLIIIGAGPAGYTAAIYASRANLSPHLITGNQPGGQLMITTDVENYPGFEKPILGPDLMEQMKKQALSYDLTIHKELIVKVDFSKRPYSLTAESGKKYICDSVIISTGAQAKWLHCPGEDEFKGYGISACATCDAMFFRNQYVIIAGGGNTAVEEALHLSKFASKVTLIHRRDTLRAEIILQKRLLAKDNVDFIWNTKIVSFHGELSPNILKSVKLHNIAENKEYNLNIDGAFIAIGHNPSTSAFKGQLNLDKLGYIITKSGTPITSKAGIYAAGDVMDKVYRQAVTAAGFGCMASLLAEQELENN